MLSFFEQSILSALVYFDMFDYPLTLLELRRHLLVVDERRGAGNYSPGDIDKTVRSSERLQKVIRFQNGFFYLRGREQIAAERARRYVWAVRKYRRAQRIVRLLSRLPFVRLVAVSNSLSYNNARDESDIDLFIVTKPGGEWWARFLALAFLGFLRLRPGQGGVRDKICLSFFVDSDHLNLESLRVNERDVYFPLWLSTLYPLYDAGGYYERLWQANGWMRAWLPGARPLSPHPLRQVNYRIVVRYLFEWLLRPFSLLVAYLQRQHFPPEISSRLNIDTTVRVEPGILKFHTNDRRESYARQFFARLNSVSDNCG